MSEYTAIWDVIQDWLDRQAFPPTQSKLAQRIGVSRSAVSDWKVGKSRPSPDHLATMAEIMEPTFGPASYGRLLTALVADLGYMDEKRPGRPAVLFLPTESGRARYRDPRRREGERGGDTSAIGVSVAGDNVPDAVAAYEEETSIAGEQEESDTP